MVPDAVMSISLKRSGHPAPGLLFCLLLTACAFHSKAQTPSEYILWQKAFFPIARKFEKFTFRQALDTGPYSVEVFQKLFWDRRDPTSDTDSNEYQARLLARLEECRDVLTPGGDSIPDDRVIPFIYFGQSTREDVVRERKKYDRVDWVYEPPEDYILAGQSHSLLRQLPFRVTFRVSEEGRYTLCPMRRQPWHPGSPRNRRFNYTDTRELTTLIQDENTDFFLKAAAVWRLRMDIMVQSLTALLTAAVGADTQIVSELEEALQPLTLLISEDMTLATAVLSGSEVGESVVPDIVPLIPEAGVDPDPAVTESSSTTITELLARSYDPTRHFQPGVVDSLRREAAAADSALRSHGWLEPEEARALYIGPLALARTLLDSDTPFAAHEFLEPYLRRDLGTNAEAWHLNALALAESPTAGGRQQSEESIRKALRLDPGNLRYLLALAQILYRRTYAAYAEDMLNHILRGAPTLASAYAVKAIIWLEYYWKLGWRSQPWSTAMGNGPPIVGGYDLKLHYSVYRAAATDMINRALAFDPDDLFATWWLGRHYLLARQWSAAIPVMNFLIKNEAHTAEAYLGRGLSFQHLGLLDQAMADYKMGLSLLPADIRLLADDPRWVTAPSEGGIGFRDQIISNDSGRTTTTGTGGAVGDSTAAITREVFWRSRDPLFTTGINERMVEQHRRFAYVTWFFAVPNLGMRGWETHRGRLYLRYGEPLEYQAIERALGWSQAEPDEISIIEDREIDWESTAVLTRNLGLAHRWTYPGVEFRFTSGWLTGNFALWDMAKADADLDIKPESIRVVGGRPIRNMETVWFAFRDDSGRDEWIPVLTIPALSYEIAKRHWTTTWEHPMTCLVLDRDWNIIAEQQFSFPVAEYLVKRGGIWIGPDLLLPDEVPVDRAKHLALELTFLEREPAYSSRDDMPVLESAGLHLSSLVTAREIIEGERISSLPDGRYLIRDTVAMDPIVDEFHSPFDPLYVYFEVYGLERDEFGATSYQLSLSLTNLEEQHTAPNPLVEALGRLLRRKAQLQCFSRDTASLPLLSSSSQSGSPRKQELVPIGSISRSQTAIPVSVRSDQLV